METFAYFNAVPGRNADLLIEAAISHGADIVFTTSPKLVGASLRSAVKHPTVRILNCSMEMPYASIRTYYTRVYEAKFITGAIAGAMARHRPHRLCGGLPQLRRARQHQRLCAGCPHGQPPAPALSCAGPACPTRRTRWPSLPARASRWFRAATHRCRAAPSRSSAPSSSVRAAYCKIWLRPSGTGGQFYENVVHSVLDGGWVRDKSGTDGRAVNYWWGMNSGVMDVLLSRELPSDVAHLARILRTGVTAGMIDPFACRITDQNGTVRNSGRHGLDVEQIVHMDYLCDAVDGTIPEYDDLTEQARPMYRMQGIHRDQLPAEKEATL